MTTNITFNNRENENVNTEDGRNIWISRACAVVAEVCMYNIEDKTWYVLLGKRGKGTPDFQGYWCLPCGYLDWDETLCDAMIREVWEETGLYLPHLSAQEQFAYSPNSCVNPENTGDEKPWAVSDSLSTATQNISFHFAVFFSWKGLPGPALTFDNSEPDEVEELGWIPLAKAHQMSLAFSHNKRILQVFEEKKSELNKIENWKY